MPISAAPMEITETATPISRAICCARGVAPTRNPVFKSCEVLPALADAMQTTPPIANANAPKAGAVQCKIRNMAEVAMSVAMAIPEMGLDDVPINPVMREETVTKRNPKMTTKIAAAMLAYQVVLASFTGMKVSMPHIMARTS